MALIPPERLMVIMSATANAKLTLKPGDKIRAVRSLCHSKKESYLFELWDGDWIVSRSGINDISAISIDLVNGQPVDFSKPLTVTLEEATKVYKENERRRSEYFDSRPTIENKTPF